MATSEWVNQVLVGYEGSLRTPFAPAAFCRNAHFYFNDFHGSAVAAGGVTADFDEWNVDELTDGTITMADADGGVIQLNGITADGDGIQMQTAEMWTLPAANYHLWYEARIMVTDADDADWMVGLASTDTNVFSTDPTELVVFRGDDGDANIDFQVRSGGTGDQADTGVDLSNGTYVRLGFHVNGTTSVTPYINDTAYTAVTANIPTAEMGLIFANVRGATAATNTLSVDWVRVVKTVAR